MNIKKLSTLSMSVLTFLWMTVSQAGIPLWTFTPLTPTHLNVPANGTVQVQYRVTNQSNRSHTLVLQPMAGITQITGGPGICASNFLLPGRGASCILSLLIHGNQISNSINSGPLVCQQGSRLQCYQPSAANSLHINVTPANTNATLSVSGSPLVLIANGSAGILTVTNTSTDVTATNITSNFTGTALQGNVTETGNTCANVAPGASCTLTYTPGSGRVVQTSFPIAGANTTTVNASIVILGVGDAFGGGIVACTDGGLNNLIAASADNSSDIEWGMYVLTNAQSDTDGAANTATIISVLGNNGGTPYAAQLCDYYEVDSQGNSPCQAGKICYKDWFLPAREQLHCLFLNRAAIGGFMSTLYWTSTEQSITEAWFQSFAADIQFVDDKSFLNPVRCVRALS